MLQALATYVLAAMLFWAPAKDHAPTPEAETLARYDAIAHDVAETTLDEHEAPLFKSDPHRAHTALLLAAVAFKESHYWAYVDDGRCNSRAWKQEHGWAKELCDGGQAWSFWQIHDGYSSPSGWRHGILLDGDGWKHGEGGYVGPDLVRDRKLAARVALHFLRKSMKGSGSLCGYTGESAITGCPKAKERLAAAADYLRAHPFEPPPPSAALAPPARLRPTAGLAPVRLASGF